ncbi:54S ribosomal protein L4, mitochondrial [Porphyridium purpureum]|uniref:Large ribosomal subunit protein uL29m n=1 Tax=Porphyridium purpureum TaxID=35688 RepID=A0A5J4YYL8_PORPP|nr:54S ribosomal protein L4, mitochondrial [Porphyridium purpureum]|eukprot:POR9676..scf209_3
MIDSAATFSSRVARRMAEQCPRAMSALARDWASRRLMSRGGAALLAWHRAGVDTGACLTRAQLFHARRHVWTDTAPGQRLKGDELIEERIRQRDAAKTQQHNSDTLAEFYGDPTVDERVAKVRSMKKPLLRDNSGLLDLLDPSGQAAQVPCGRSWRVAELRLKSFEDLHKLWWILLRERAVLHAERHYCRVNGYHWKGGSSRLFKIKTSMRGIKIVVGERKKAFKAARLLLLQREYDANPLPPQTRLEFKQRRVRERLAKLKRRNRERYLAEREAIAAQQKATESVEGETESNRE